MKDPFLTVSVRKGSFMACVQRTTGSPGHVRANQSSTAAHASAAYPWPHAAGRNM